MDGTQHLVTRSYQRHERTGCWQRCQHLLVNTWLHSRHIQVAESGCHGLGSLWCPRLGQTTARHGSNWMGNVEMLHVPETTALSTRASELKRLHSSEPRFLKSTHVHPQRHSLSSSTNMNGKYLRYLCGSGKSVELVTSLDTVPPLVLLDDC